jgi:hypothetical protein
LPNLYSKQLLNLKARQMAWTKAQKRRKTKLAGRTRNRLALLVQLVPHWEVKNKKMGWLVNCWEGLEDWNV